MSVAFVYKEILVILFISCSCLSFSDDSSSSPISESSLNVSKLNSVQNTTKFDTIKEVEVPTSNRLFSRRRQQKRKPLNNIIFGIYKNYRSTYLGNRTSSKYRELNGVSAGLKNVDAYSRNGISEKTSKTKKRKKKRRRNNKNSKSSIYNSGGEYRYNFGTGVNVTLDMNRDIVNVNLDEDCLKDVLSGFSYEDYNEEGRKKNDNKKYEMVSKVLPLFILPFLIQSAIIPFIVAKLKLLLMKSILVGKLALFLLIISAIKNSQRTNNYEQPPSYYAWEPSRRSDIYHGYKVEGRPHILVS